MHVPKNALAFVGVGLKANEITLARVRFAGYTCEPLRVYALLPGKKLQPEKVRHFLDSLAGHARLTREDMGWQFHHDKGTSPA